MADKKTLEIDQNLAFQRREWIVQRVGWWVLVAFVVAASLGVFGDGPVSSARAGTGQDPFWLEYERFVRVGATSRIALHEGASGPRSALQLRIARSYFDAIVIERVTPEPTQVDVGERQVTMRFDPPQESPPLTIVLEIRPQRPGLRTATFTNGQGAAISFSQLTYF
jgi:hypothetical protein